ncbi:MAG: putative zinc transporter msc2 [Marteilia pararefringens]
MIKLNKNSTILLIEKLLPIFIWIFSFKIFDSTELDLLLSSLISLILQLILISASKSRNIFTKFEPHNITIGFFYFLKHILIIVAIFKFGPFVTLLFTIIDFDIFQPLFSQCLLLNDNDSNLNRSRIAAIFLTILIGFTLFHSDFNIASLLLFFLPIIELLNMKENLQDPNNFAFVKPQSIVAALISNSVLLLLQKSFAMQPIKFSLPTIICGILLFVAKSFSSLTDIITENTFEISMHNFMISTPIAILLNYFILGNGFHSTIFLYCVLSALLFIFTIGKINHNSKISNGKYSSHKEYSMMMNINLFVAHVLSNAQSPILLGLITAVAVEFPPNSQFPNGFKSLDKISGLINALFLIILSLLMLLKALYRLVWPIQVESHYLTSVSVIGLIINLIGLFGFSHAHHHGHSHNSTNSGSKEDKHEHQCSHSHHDANIQGVFLHILSDTLGSVAVILSSLAVSYYGWNRFDSITSIFVSLVTIYPSYLLIADILMDLSMFKSFNNIDTNTNIIKDIQSEFGIVKIDKWIYWQDELNNGKNNLMISVILSSMSHNPSDINHYISNRLKLNQLIANYCLI